MAIIASNFKTNHTRASSKIFIEEINNFINSNNIKDEILIFPSFTSLDNFNTNINLKIGAQNAYPANLGSYTGEIGASQLNEFNIKTILIGHSERRHILKESQEEIAKKFNFYKDLGYKIIYCIGEPLEVKKLGIEKTLEYLYEQFDGIDTNYENLIFAYEPVWAIGTGISATTEDIENIHNAIKSKFNKPLLYGGSVKINSAKEICNIKNVDGVLIGTASWKKEDFIQIIKNIKELK